MQDECGCDYDANSNRLCRENIVKTTLSELNHAENPGTANTEYDGLDRLVQWRRGTLDGPRATRHGHPARAAWAGCPCHRAGASRYQTVTLESPGNPDWSGARTHGSGSVSSANQITAVAAGSAHVGYDPAGNMTKMPRPAGRDGQPPRRRLRLGGTRPRTSQIPQMSCCRVSKSPNLPADSPNRV